MSSHRTFELHRQCDQLVYRFHRAERSDGTVGYKREGEDLWIVCSPHHGWVAMDEVAGTVTGRPWNVFPNEQLDFPPEGEWVSKKGTKSYVYELKYTE